MCVCVCVCGRAYVRVYPSARSLTETARRFHFDNTATENCHLFVQDVHCILIIWVIQDHRPAARDTACFDACLFFNYIKEEDCGGPIFFHLAQDP